MNHFVRLSVYLSHIFENAFSHLPLPPSSPFTTLSFHPSPFPPLSLIKPPSPATSVSFLIFITFLPLSSPSSSHCQPFPIFNILKFICNIFRFLFVNTWATHRLPFVLVSVKNLPLIFVNQNFCLFC